MSEQEKWKWQEPGTTWKGIGLYHITLTITDRQPLLGTLAITNNDPTTAKVLRTALGNALIDCLLSIPHHHPEVQVLHFCLMPDHRSPEKAQLVHCSASHPLFFTLRWKVVRIKIFCLE